MYINIKNVWVSDFGQFGDPDLEKKNLLQDELFYHLNFLTLHQALMLRNGPISEFNINAMPQGMDCGKKTVSHRISNSLLLTLDL